MNNKKKIIAAMSGGVDSSVTAAILKNAGYDVVGVFMKFWSPRLGATRLARGKSFYENRCCSLEAEADARKVANKLGIPFYVMDARKEFKKKVVDYFINEYKKGRTPNPCVVCNQYIKFRFLLEKALLLKADYIATGHYARIKNGNLLTAKDKNKDQSYFLWTLDKNQLNKILFPIGDYTKEQVRAMAKKFGLQIHEKRDSQEICFVNTTIQDFLRKNLPAEALAKAGPVFTIDNKKVGEHEGLIFYTIGQRKGIKIGGIGPFYVVDKDFKKNVLIVAQSDFNETLFKKEMVVNNVNWINKPTKFPFRCNVKIRYLTKSVPCIVSKIQNSKLNQNSRPPCFAMRSGQAKFKIRFAQPQRAITPGQSAVFYLKNEVPGGGIIE